MAAMDEYVTKDLTPVKIDDLLDGMWAATGEDPEFGPDAADIVALIEYVEETRKWRKEVLQPAVNGLMEVHIATGIDLKNWEPVLNLVQSSNPEFSIEGEREW